MTNRAVAKKMATKVPSINFDNGILIVGASGFLGSNILLAAQADYRCIAHSSSHEISLEGIIGIQSDLKFAKSGIDLVSELAPSLVVNCAALADIDKCENNPELAQRLNADLAAEIAIGCRNVGAKLVHVSTDAVFGKSDGMLDIDSPRSPINVYGHTKSEGESNVMELHPSSLIVRTNIIGWSPTGTRSLLEFFYNALNNGKSVGGYHDYKFRPVSASNFWPLVLDWVIDEKFGIHHAFGSDLISKYEFGRRVARTFDLDADLIIPKSMFQDETMDLRPKCLNLRPSEVTRNILLDIDLALEELRNLAGLGYRKKLSSI